MATQGLITGVKNGNVWYKIVVGCDGSNITKVAGWLRDRAFMHSNFGKEMLGILQLVASDLGCDSCRVILLRTEIGIGSDSLEPLSDLYKDTFDCPNFNPRWDVGTADYAEVVNYG